MVTLPYKDPNTEDGKVPIVLVVTEVPFSYKIAGNGTFDYNFTEPGVYMAVGMHGKKAGRLEFTYYHGTPIDKAVPIIQSAQVGQTIVVKLVDENGKPTEWEAANSTFDFNIIKQGSKLVLNKRTFAEIVEASSTGKINTITPFLSITGMNSDSSALIIENIPACYFATNKAMGSTEMISIRANFMLSDGTIVKYQVNPDDTVTEVTE